MRRPQAVVKMVLLGALATWLPSAAAGQDFALAGRTPRFLYARTAGATPTEIDATRHAVLRKVISLRVDAPTIGRMLAAIERQTGLAFAHDEDFPLQRPITLRADSITVAAALSAILLDTGVDVLLTPGASAALVREKSRPRPAQVGSLIGRVTDAKTGSGVRQAEVILDGTRWRVTADTMGQYRLTDVTAGSYTLMVRRLGYAKHVRQVIVHEGREDTVNVAMEPVVARLNELVTTATGRRRRLDIANDVTTINADSVMRAAPIRSVTDLLENRVPGLTVQRTSGAPGDPARLRLRGVSSPLRNNDPVVIVDGVRIYAEQSAARSANLAVRDQTADISTTAITKPPYATPSPLDYIDPNTIETIEVLKGPSAATMYGQDAANGVIVITTKRGRAGPARWNASTEYSRDAMARTNYPMLYLRWGHTLTDKTPILCSITNVVFAEATTGGVACVGDSVVTSQLLNDPSLTILDKGHRSSLSLGTSGGTQALRYAVTGSYQDMIGLIKLPAYEADRYRALLGVAPPDWMQRPLGMKQWGVTASVDARLGANANLSFGTSLSRTEQRKSSLLNQLANLMGTYLDRSRGVYYQGGEGLFFVVDQALRSYYERATDNATAVLNRLSLDWRPRSWMTLTADAGLNLAHRADNVFFPRGPANKIYSFGGVSGAADTTGYVNDGQGTALTSTINVRANAIKPLGKGFQLQVGAGVNYTGTSTNDVASFTHELAPGSSLQGAIIDTVRRAEASDATFGYWVEPSVSNRRFSFSSGLRLDGGKSFGANISGLRLPSFPKLGFSYLVSDEPWFPLNELFQSLRVRVSYGRASRQPGPTDRLRLYGVPAQMFADSQYLTAVMLQTLGNTTVRPERSGEFEGGFDADMLDSRIRLSLTGYRKRTSDALLWVPVAPSVYGNGVAIVKNIGVTSNVGLDIMAGADVVRSGSLIWALEMWVTQRRDMVVSLAPGLEPFYTIGDPSSGGERIAAGYPLNGRWSRPILGYADANGNGALEIAEVQIGDTAIYVGNTVPNYAAKLATTLSLWHGAVTVNAGFQYEDGLTQRNDLGQDLAIFSPGRQVPGTSLDEQAATIDLKTFKNQDEPLSDYNFIQTVNTLRFNELGVSYAVPTNLARKLGAQTLSIAVQGRNLGLHTNYRGLDPNVNAFGTGNNTTDAGVLPQPRTWQLRISATY